MYSIILSIIFISVLYKVTLIFPYICLLLWPSWSAKLGLSTINIDRRGDLLPYWNKMPTFTDDPLNFQECNYWSTFPPFSPPDPVPRPYPVDLHIFLNMTCGTEFPVWFTGLNISQVVTPSTELEWWQKGSG